MSHPSEAETYVRNVASSIGLSQDSDLLQTVCDKMREEFVVHTFQLSILDSRQWEHLGAPIGLAAAVKYHMTQPSSSTTRKFEAAPESPRQFKPVMVVPPSPPVSEPIAPHDDDGVKDPVGETLLRAPSDILNDNDDAKEISMDVGNNDSDADMAEKWEEEYDDNEVEEEPNDEDILERLLSTASPVSPVETAPHEESQEVVAFEAAEKVNRGITPTNDEGKVVEETAPKEKVIVVETVTSDNESSSSSDPSNDDIQEKALEDIALSENEILLETTPTDEEVGVSTTSNEKEAENKPLSDAVPLATDSEESSKDAIEQSREWDCTTREEPPQFKNDSMKSDDCDTTACESTDNEGDDDDVTDRSLLDTDSVFSGQSEDMLGIPMITPASSADEDDDDEEEDVTELIGTLGNQLEKHLWTEATLKENDDDATVVVSNVSPERKIAVEKEQQTKSIKVLDAPSEIAETSTFETETETLQEILRQLPDKDHRIILSQLMIMTNARGQIARIKLALQVKDALLESMEANHIEANPDDAVRLIFHLVRLKKQYRVLFGRSLFKAMSKLYKKSEKEKGGDIRRKKSSSSRRSTKPPPSESVINETRAHRQVASF